MCGRPRIRFFGVYQLFPFGTGEKETSVQPSKKISSQHREKVELAIRNESFSKRKNLPIYFF